MAKYPHAIDGKDLNRIDRSAIDSWKTTAGKIAQNGLRYPKSTPNTAVMTSHSQEDIEKVLKNNGWAHSVKPKRVQPGWQIVIIPNQAELDKHGDKAFGVIYTATNYPRKVPSYSQDWPSE